MNIYHWFQGRLATSTIGLPAICVGLLFLAITPAHAAGERAASPETVRHIAQGELIGFSTDAGMDVWAGIPFAEPLSAERRWTMPIPHGGWQGRKAFTEDPQPCLQFGKPGSKLPEAGYIGVEDCLVLNVMAPSGIDPSTANLPVMVWIHGGGNSIGYPGNLDRNLLVPEQEVVLVTIQYRVGPLGFFSLPALRDEGLQSANLGIEDQILALKWAQANIAAFGGDAGNVTIFGQSAGARNAFALILSPRAQGLFNKVIMQSGTSTTVERRRAETPETDGGARNNSADIVARLLVRMGKADDEPAARAMAGAMPADVLLRFLRQVPPRDLLEVYQKDAKDFMFALPSAIRDGYTLPDAEPEALWSDTDAVNAVPMMIGSNQNELGMLLLFSGQFGEPGPMGIPRVTDDAGFMRVANYLARIWKFTGVDRIADWQAAAQRPVYAYRFDWNEEPELFGVDAGRYVGAAHNFEIPFVFGQFDEGAIPAFLLTRKNAPGREALSAKMREFWGSFARSGVPQAENQRGPEWPQWQADAPANMLLDTDGDGGVRTTMLQETRDQLEQDLREDTALTSMQRCFVLTLMLTSDVWDRDDVGVLGFDACKTPNGETGNKDG